MRGLLLTLWLCAPVRADNLLPQDTPFQWSQRKLVSQIAQWRSDYGYGLKPELLAELERIKGQAQQATSEPRLAEPRRRLDAWRRLVLKPEFAKIGKKDYSFEDFVGSRSKTVEYYASQRAELDAGLAAVERLRQLMYSQPQGLPAYNGGRPVQEKQADGKIPLPRPRPVICAIPDLPPRPVVPEKYAALRASLVKEGANPIVVDHVIDRSLKKGADPVAILSLVKKESHFDTAVISKVGARGALQIMPKTAEGLGIKDQCQLHDLKINLDTGITYMQGLWGSFVKRGMDRVDTLPANLKVSADNAVAGYNAGPTAVRRHGGVPPFAETRDYVAKFWTNYGALRKLVVGKP